VLYPALQPHKIKLNTNKHSNLKMLQILYSESLCTFDVQMTVHHDIFLKKKKKDALISRIYFWNKTTCFEQSPWPSSGVFHCTHSNGICHTGFADPARKLSAKPV
jgi:hypothetical protein